MMTKPPPPSVRDWLQWYGMDMCRLAVRWWVTVEMARLKHRYPDPEERWQKAEEAARRFGTERDR